MRACRSPGCFAQGCGHQDGVCTSRLARRSCICRMPAWLVIGRRVYRGALGLLLSARGHARGQRRSTDSLCHPCVRVETCDLGRAWASACRCVRGISPMPFPTSMPDQCRSVHILRMQTSLYKKDMHLDNNPQIRPQTSSHGPFTAHTLCHRPPPHVGASCDAGVGGRSAFFGVGSASEVIEMT